MGMGRAGRAARPPRLPPGGEYYRAEQPNEDTVVLFCHFGVTCVLLSHLLGISPCRCGREPVSPTSVTILNTEERREGIASFRMTAFGGHLPPVRGGAGTVLLRPVLRNLRKLGAASRLTSNLEKRPARNMQDVFSAPRGVS